ncbi:MAG: hypothetical protein IPI85_14135 [Dehalococcoidia bacterium]|nr:hypothetical protein [Dehalococcoidia bacterium]
MDDRRSAGDIPRHPRAEGQLHRIAQPGHQRDRRVPQGTSRQPGNCQVLDARTDGEWDGTNDRGNKRVGRVPGAHHLEWLRFVHTDDSRKFLPAAEIQALLDGAGIERGKPTITYCQGGIRAAHAAFTMELLGYDNVRVYDGSMREWANREDTPLTTTA